MVNNRQQQIIQKIFKLNNSEHPFQCGANLYGQAFAPSNIALVKYWGKSDIDLNIPYTDSLSISLGDLGATTKISIENDIQDSVILNNNKIAENSEFYKRLVNYLDIFNITSEIRPRFKVETTTNIPVAAGLASSACGFAALVLALDNMYHWQLDKKYLSILARLGSGSAARSLWQGFVYWQKGQDIDGMDSYAYKISDIWPDLCIGLLILSEQTKPISSREAMLKTVSSSILYQKGWSEQVINDMGLINTAIKNQDLMMLGETAENNALSMHATMLAAKPAICYSTHETVDAMHTIWQLRKQGLQVYFTQDAGPNLKLIFSRKDSNSIIKNFSDIKIVTY